MLNYIILSQKDYEKNPLESQFWTIQYSLTKKK